MSMKKTHKLKSLLRSPPGRSSNEPYFRHIRYLNELLKIRITRDRMKRLGCNTQALHGWSFSCKVIRTSISACPVKP